MNDLKFLNCINCKKTIKDGITRSPFIFKLCSEECCDDIINIIHNKFSTSPCKELCKCGSDYYLYGVVIGGTRIVAIDILERINQSIIQPFKCHSYASSICDLLIEKNVLLACEVRDYPSGSFDKWCLNFNNSIIYQNCNKIKKLEEDMNEIKKTLSDFMNLLSNSK